MWPSRIAFWLFCLTLVLPMPALAATREPYEGRFGIRLTAEGGVYGSYINSDANTQKDAPAQADKYFNRLAGGWMVPLQLEGTYCITNALEVLLGVRYAFSNTLYGTDPYALSYFGVSLGYRYYINITEPVKAYFSGQVATVFALPTIDARFSFGLQWDINDLVAVFLQPTLGGTALLSRVEAAGLGAQSYVTLGLGVQGRF